MIKYYLIHGIDSSRKPFMEDQFQRFGITDVTWINYPNKNDPLPHVCTKPTLPKGMISCTYKHYLALKDIVEKGHEQAVIMEDNIEFRGNVPEALSKYLKDLPEDWDCLFDSDFFIEGFRESPVSSDMSVYKKSNESEMYWGGASKGAHFIFLTQAAAKKLYEIFLPFHESSDHHYNNLFRKLNMNVYWSDPVNVHKIDRPSTWIDEPSKNPKKISWLRK